MLRASLPVVPPVAHPAPCRRCTGFDVYGHVVLTDRRLVVSLPPGVGLSPTNVPPWLAPAPPVGSPPVHTVVDIPLASVAARSLALVSPLWAAQHVAFTSRPPPPEAPRPPGVPAAAAAARGGGPTRAGQPAAAAAAAAAAREAAGAPPPPVVGNGGATPLPWPPPEPSLDAQTGVEEGVRVIVEAADLGANAALHGALVAALGRSRGRPPPRRVPPDPHLPPIRVALVAGGAGGRGGGCLGRLRLCRYVGTLVNE